MLGMIGYSIYSIYSMYVGITDILEESHDMIAEARVLMDKTNRALSKYLRDNPP